MGEEQDTNFSASQLLALKLLPELWTSPRSPRKLATSAARAVVSTLKISQQTGRVSDALLGRYIRDGAMFAGNASGALL
jgi:hypothetical protein